MKLFKEKKQREIKEDDSLLVKLWYNKRTHALMVLGMYGIFLLILLILASISSSKPVNNNIVKAKDVEKYFISLNDKEISYSVVINSNNEDIYYFTGKNVDDNIVGKLLHNNEDYQISISNDECKVGTVTDDVFIGDSDKLCPDVINYDIFNYEKLYNDVLNKDTTRIRKYNDYYSFKDKNTAYKLYVKNDTLSKVDISNKDVTYSINYFENITEDILNEDITEE